LKFLLGDSLHRPVACQEDTHRRPISRNADYQNPVNPNDLVSRLYTWNIFR
jgi:hypothetical protein